MDFETFTTKYLNSTTNEELNRLSEVDIHQEILNRFQDEYGYEVPQWLHIPIKDDLLSVSFIIFFSFMLSIKCNRISLK